MMNRFLVLLSNATWAATRRQGLTVVHFSAQREHFMSHIVGCFAGFSDKTAQVELRSGRV